MSGGNWKELFAAGCRGNLALLTYHLNAGVDVNYAHPEFLSTPLVGAILAKQGEAALLMLERGADPNLRSEFDGMTPLQAARHAGLPGVEAKLKEMGVPEPTGEASKKNSWWTSWRL